MNQERPRRATSPQNYAGLDSEDCGLGLGMRGSDADGVDPSEILHASTSTENLPASTETSPVHGSIDNPILVEDDPPTEIATPRAEPDGNLEELRATIAALKEENRVLQNSSVKCPICFEAQTSGWVSLNECGHVVCKTCFPTLSHYGQGCPTCRADFEYGLEVFF